MSGYVFEIRIGERDATTPRHCNYCGSEIVSTHYYHVVPSKETSFFYRKVFHNDSCAAAYISYTYSGTPKTIIHATAEMLQRFFGEEVTED